MELAARLLLSIPIAILPIKSHVPVISPSFKPELSMTEMQPRPLVPRTRLLKKYLQNTR